MPRTCAICGHKKRVAIEKAVLAGDALRAIAGRWSVSRQAYTIWVGALWHPSGRCCGGDRTVGRCLQARKKLTDRNSSSLFIRRSKIDVTMGKRSARHQT